MAGLTAPLCYASQRHSSWSYSHIASMMDTGKGVGVATNVGCSRPHPRVRWSSTLTAETPIQRTPGSRIQSRSFRRSRRRA